jgi:hypothetical protein
MLLQAHPHHGSDQLYLAQNPESSSQRAYLEPCMHWRRTWRSQSPWASHFYNIIQQSSGWSSEVDGSNPLI